MILNLVKCVEIIVICMANSLSEEKHCASYTLLLSMIPKILR